MKTIYSLVLILMAFTSIAQRPIELITNLSNPLPTEVGDLIEQYENYTLTVINHTDREQTIFFLADIYGDNGVSITMDRLYEPSQGFTIGPNSMELLTSSDIEDLNSALPDDAIFYEGVTQQQLLFGSIPEGNYTLCLNAFDLSTGTLLSVGCSMPFYIGNANVPTIITPFEDEVIPQSEIPIFNISWEFPANDPIQAMNMHYEVKMVDITANYDWDIEELFSDNGIPGHLEEIVEGQTFYMYNNFGDDPEMIYGHEYGVRVRAFDPADGLSINNAGYTEIRRFWYGSPGETLIDSTANQDIAAQDTLPSDCEGRCNPVLVSNTTPVTDLSTITSIKIGNFYLENYNLTASGERFFGDAEISLHFLSEINIKVQVDGIKINSEGKVYEGTVRSQLAQEETVQGIAEYLRIPSIANPALDYIPEETATQISDILESVRTLDALIGNNAVGLPLGFPIALRGNEFYLGLTDIILSPDGAKAKVMLSAKLALFDGENSLLLVGDSMCIHPQGFGGEYTFGLKNNLALTSNQSENAVELLLTGSNTSATNYCKVQMGCEGLESLSLYGHALFPRSILTPVVANVETPPDDLKVMARFGFTLDTGNEADSIAQSNNINWLASIDVDKFEITGLKGWQFQVTDAYIDMSDLSNPPNINFPQDYHTITNDFRGFYLREASVSPPAHIITDSTSFMIRDLLIDPNIYGFIEAVNVLPIEKGSLDGYGFGIDSLNIHFYNNAMVSGRMSGPLQIPITDVTDSLYYFALIQNNALPGESPDFIYVFDVSLQDDIAFPFMIADAILYDDSYLEIGFMPSAEDEVFVNTYLHGLLNIDTDAFYPSSLPSLPANIKMMEMEYGIDYSSKDGFNSENTYIRFASPQKGLGGFPINLDNFNVSLNAEYQTIAVQFNVDLSFAKGELDLAAGITFSLVSNLKTLDAVGNIISDGGQGALKTIKSLRLEKIQFDSIYIDVDKGAFGFYGMVAFYNNPLPQGGRDKGVHGEVIVTLPIVQVELTVIFGNTGTPPELEEGESMVYSEDFYTYWYVSGKVILAVGIPISSGVGIYGLGGGVGYNMIQVPPQIENGQITGEAVFTPRFNSFRLEFTVILGTLPKPDAFNADVTLIAQFSNGGLDMIGIEGDGYIMTPIMERSDPQVYVGVGIYLYAPNEDRDWFIDGYLRVSVNIADGKFRGNIQNSEVENLMVDASFYVSAESWYFYAGEPDMNPFDDIDPRGSAEFLINDNLKADFKAYMMVGHGIPMELPPLPADIQRILNDPSGDLNETQSVDNVTSTLNNNEVEKGSGFAHGAYGSLTADIDAYLLYASLRVFVGYDMNLTQKPFNCANTGKRIGINGWYAEGQAYAGIEGNLGVQVKLFGDNPTRFHLMDIAAAIALAGGAPAPAYFGGRASVQYSLLGGKLEGRESFQFSVGERCSVAPNDPLAGINFIEFIDPSNDQEEVPPYGRGLCKFVLPMDETIYIPSPVFDANNEIIRIDELGYTPKVFYELRKDFVSDKGLVDIQNNVWIDEDHHYGLVLRPTTMLQQNRWYKMKITIKAIDELTHNYLIVNGKQWTQDTTIRFKVGPYPDDLYDVVKYAVPLPYERYYLQAENATGKIYFTQGIPRDFYFPTSDENSIGQISYYIRYTNLQDQTEIEVPFNNYCSASIDPHLSFEIPQLQNERIYSMQVIRKNTAPVFVIDRIIGNTGQVEIVKTNNATMVLNTEILPPGEVLKKHEFLLYHTYFRTSKFNNMAEKIASANVVSSERIGSSATYGQKLRVSFTLQEKFEKRDFQAFQPLIYGAENITFQPRVRMTDIFNKPYHNDKAEPKINGFKNYYESTVQNTSIFNWPFPSNLEVVWTPITCYYRINHSAMSGPMDEPLSEEEISTLWQNYLENGSFGYVFLNQNPRSFNLSTGFSSIGPNYTLLYNTHYRVNQDKQTILNWANDYLTSSWLGMPQGIMLSNTYPTFVTKKNQLNASNLKLENNNGTYGVYFNRNLSPIPGGESWSLFLKDIEFTTSSGTIATITETLSIGNANSSNSSGTTATSSSATATSSNTTNIINNPINIFIGN